MENNKTTLESFFELIRFAFFALIIVIPIRVLIAEPFVVSGNSMIPTFQNGDYLIVDKISSDFKEIERNDIIIFKYPNDTKKFFIKRVIALPFETINIKNNIVTIFNKENENGFILDESFLKNNSSSDINIKLENDEYFVMGDNRIASSDSRYWGPLKKDFIIGKAFLRLLPINNVDMFPGDF